MTKVADAVKGVLGGDPLEGWSEEDKRWLEQVEEEGLRQIAARHGRRLFSLCMQVGTATHAAGVISRHTRGNRAATTALQVAVQIQNDLASGLLIAWAITPAAYSECWLDIERYGALRGSLVQEGDRVSPGGIVLDS